MHRVWYALALSFGLAGLCLWGLKGSYVLRYLLESENQARGEYLQGAAIAFLIASPFWLLAWAAGTPIKERLSRKWAVFLQSAGIFTVTALVATQVIPMFLYFLDG